jgi:predicted ATP-dependent endonuclease of OLD family
MRIKKVRIKNFKSIKDTNEIKFDGSLFVLAGQNESGKSSILEAIATHETKESDKDSLNFELEKEGDLIQRISITFCDFDNVFSDEIINELFKFIISKNRNIVIPKTDEIIDVSAFDRLKEFTIEIAFDFSKGDSPDALLTIDDVTFGILKSSIKKKYNQNESLDELFFDLSEYNSELAEIVWKNTPNVILFNDFSTLLPDKILIDDIEKETVKGQKAVKNLEKLLKVSFSEIAKKQIPQKNSTTESESQHLSANFQKAWQQKIFGNNKVNIKFFIENNEAGKKEISFFVETRDNEFLSPRKRSKGMIWFLSLWLELMARENGKKTILLFDEPGHYLHIKANKDMLAVFHKLNKKGHQIIYSTHTPSLIELDNLHNIGLVINNEKEGTIVEGLTTSKIDTSNKRDALQPISEAMGLEPINDFSILNLKNVIVEGLSDYWYYTSMAKILNRQTNYRLVPSIGIKLNNVFPLISFCIGYGLDWLLIMENGPNPMQTKDELKEKIFNNSDEEVDKKVKLIPYSEIEDVFSVADIRLIDNKVLVGDKRLPSIIIGKSRKIIFSKLFAQKVDKKEITFNDLSKETIRRFNEIFDWIDARFN